MTSSTFWPSSANNNNWGLRSRMRVSRHACPLFYFLLFVQVKNISSQYVSSTSVFLGCYYWSTDGSQREMENQIEIHWSGLLSYYPDDLGYFLWNKIIIIIPSLKDKQGGEGIHLLAVADPTSRFVLSDLLHLLQLLEAIAFSIHCESRISSKEWEELEEEVNLIPSEGKLIMKLIYGFFSPFQLKGNPSWNTFSVSSSSPRPSAPLFHRVLERNLIR